MSTNRTNELGNAILKALDISPDWAGELTLHSVPGELETVTVVFHAWNPDTSEMCEHCAGTGMVTDTDHPRHWPGTPGTLPALYELDRLQGRCNCNVVTWCRQCAQGEHARGLLRSMTTTPNAR